MKGKTKLVNADLQAMITQHSKNIVWADLLKAVDTCEITTDNEPEAKSYILPALSSDEYITLCRLLNMAAIGERIKPDENLHRLKKHIFTSAAALQAGTLEQMGSKPFILKMQAVPIIANME